MLHAGRRVPQERTLSSRCLFSKVSNSRALSGYKSVVFIAKQIFYISGDRRNIFTVIFYYCDIFVQLWGSKLSCSRVLLCVHFFTKASSAYIWVIIFKLAEIIHSRACVRTHTRVHAYVEYTRAFKTHKDVHTVNTHIHTHTNTHTQF